MDRPDPADRRSVRRFMAKSEGYWRDLVALKRADNASHTYDDAHYHDLLEAACERAEAEDAARLRAESPLTVTTGCDVRPRAGTVDPAHQGPAQRDGARWRSRTWRPRTRGTHCARHHAGIGGLASRPRLCGAPKAWFVDGFPPGCAVFPYVWNARLCAEDLA